MEKLEKKEKFKNHKKVHIMEKDEKVWQQKNLFPWKFYFERIRFIKH